MNLKYWKQFETSGKIADYLAFVNSAKQGTERGEQTKESSDAGVYMGDGNHTEAVSGGGIRQAYQPFD